MQTLTSTFVIIKVLTVFAFLILNSIQIDAQSGKIYYVETKENGLKFHARVVTEKDSEITFVLPGKYETFTVSKSDIKSMVEEEKKIILKKGRYLKAKGWLNEFSLAFGPNGRCGSSQGTYQLYKIITPKILIGGGIAAKGHTEVELSPEDYRTFRFTDYFVGGKLYLNNNFVRIYVDYKIGYSKARNPDQSYTDDWSSNERVTKTFTFTSGRFVQPGIGIEFAGYHYPRLGLKVGKYSQQIRYNDSFDTTLDALLFGVNVYF